MSFVNTNFNEVYAWVSYEKKKKLYEKVSFSNT